MIFDQKQESLLRCSNAVMLTLFASRAHSPECNWSQQSNASDRPKWAGYRPEPAMSYLLIWQQAKSGVSALENRPDDGRHGRQQSGDSGPAGDELNSGFQPIGQIWSGVRTGRNERFCARFSGWMRCNDYSRLLVPHDTKKSRLFLMQAG
jgi:hypothetical protein